MAETMLDLRVTPRVSSAESVQDCAQIACCNRRPAYPMSLYSSACQKLAEMQPWALHRLSGGNNDVLCTALKLSIPQYTEISHRQADGAPEL